MLPFLPDHIKENILTRLPAKSLVRFCLVSKQWQSLISDPNFIKNHLNNILSDHRNNHHRLLINSFANFYSIDFESHTFTKLHFPFESSPGVRIMGSCHGLVLVALLKRFDPRRPLIDFSYSNDIATFALWNPIRGDYAFLPECYIGFDVIHFIGFSYDSVADDYKVVRVVTYCRLGPNTGPAGDTNHRVDVYSLKTNSWKMIGVIPFYDPYILFSCQGGIIVDKSVYWLTCYEEGDESWLDNLILGFDFTNEEFKMFDIRELEDIDEDLTRSLIVINGSLGLYESGYDSMDVKVWTLNIDELNNEFGSSLHVIDKDEGMHYNLDFFTKNDKVLLTATDDELCRRNKKLVVYDLINENKIGLDFITCGMITAWFEEMIYVETLVSLKYGGCMEYIIENSKEKRMNYSKPILFMKNDDVLVIEQDLLLLLCLLFHLLSF